MRKLILFSSLLLLLSCQKSPVGFDEMERGDVSHFQETLNPKDSLSFGSFYPCGNAPFLFLGKNDKYESRVLFFFPLNDSARENITKISLRLYIQDTTPYQFRIYPLTTLWSVNATWRMASPDIQWLHPGGDFSNQLIAEGKVQKDSLSLEIPLSFLDTLLAATGLILVPEENRNLSFASFKKTGKITFTYGDKEKNFLPSFATYITNFLDTIPHSFIIGSGYVFRTYLFYPFSLEKENKIAEGEISLLLDPASSYFIRDTLEIVILQLKENFWTRREKTDYYEIPIARKTVILPNDTIIRMPIKTLLENWQREPEKNFGLYLTLYPQYQFPSFLILKRDTPSFRINFTYIPPVKGRFP